MAILLPGHPGYNAARTVFPGDVDRRPAAVVRARDAAEVARVVDFARTTGLELAIRSGGHSSAGVTDGGILLDLSRMRAVDVDLRGRTAWAETGLTAGAYTAAAGAHGLATGFGDTGSVGIGGLTLGGGVGLLVRKHGLTIDDLLAADVVTADGDLVRADPRSHPDLFWAIRGGGGNFGVATRFQFRLHEVSTVVAGTLVLAATPRIVERFIAEADAAPHDLSAVITVLPAPPVPSIPTEFHGTLIISALLVHAGHDQRAIAPFRALARPFVDTVRPVPYPQVYGPEDADHHPRLVVRTRFLDEFGADQAATLLDRLRGSGGLAQLRVLGGAITRVPNDATAYAHRHRRLMVNVAASYTGPADRPEREAWTDDTARTLGPGEPGAYVNFLTDDGPRRIREAYPGATWHRLTEIKRRYDPDNLFRLNHNITPTQETS